MANDVEAGGVAAPPASITDELIDSDLNLAPMCAECNSGKRVSGSASIRLMYRCLVVASGR